MAVETVSRDPLAAGAEQQTWITSSTQQTVQSAIQDLFHNAGKPGEVALSILHGDFLHQPLHAVITDVPVGAWTVAVAFDLLGALAGNRSFDKVADGALKLGHRRSSSGGNCGCCRLVGDQGGCAAADRLRTCRPEYCRDWVVRMVLGRSVPPKHTCPRALACAWSVCDRRGLRSSWRQSRLRARRWHENSGCWSGLNTPSESLST